MQKLLIALAFIAVAIAMPVLATHSERFPLTGLLTIVGAGIGYWIVNRFWPDAAGTNEPAKVQVGALLIMIAFFIGALAWTEIGILHQDTFGVLMIIASVITIGTFGQLALRRIFDQPPPD